MASVPVKPNQKGLQNYVPAGNPDGGEYASGTAESGSIPKEKYKETTIPYQQKVKTAKEKMKNNPTNKTTAKSDVKDATPTRAFKNEPTVKDYEEIAQHLKKQGVLITGRMEKLGADYAYNSARLLADILDEYPIFKEACKNGGLEITTGDLGYSTIANCSSTNIIIALATPKSTIKMNTNRYILNKEAKKEEVSEELGFKMPCVKENVLGYSMAHEVGHAIINHIQHDLVRNNEEMKKEREELRNNVINQRNIATAKRKISSYLEKLPKEMCKQINAIAKEMGEPNPQQFISGYGKSNVHEYFAECFANSMCGKPNILGKATKVWLERNYKNGINKTLFSKK